MQKRTLVRKPEVKRLVLKTGLRNNIKAEIK